MDVGKIKWDQSKNEWLKANRNLSFESVSAAIEEGKVIDDINHPSRPHQRIMIVPLGGFVCAVPYVENDGHIFLKTIYPDRKMKSKYQPEE